MKLRRNIHSWNCFLLKNRDKRVMMKVEHFFSSYQSNIFYILNIQPASSFFAFITEPKDAMIWWNKSVTELNIFKRLLETRLRIQELLLLFGVWWQQIIFKTIESEIFQVQRKTIKHQILGENISSVVFDIPLQRESVSTGTLHLWANIDGIWSISWEFMLSGGQTSTWASSTSTSHWLLNHLNSFS